MKQIMTCVALMWMGLGLGYGQDIVGLLDQAATAGGKEYVQLRDQIVAMGPTMAPSLEAIKAQSDIPWQRRVMARICLERMTRGVEIAAFVNYNWAGDPLFKDDPGWDTRSGCPDNFKSVVTERLAATGLAGYCYDLMWKCINENPGIGGQWDLTGRGALLKMADPDLVYWAREQLAHADPLFFDANAGYDTLLRLKDHVSLPIMFDLWLHARAKLYEIFYKGDLDGGATPEEARMGATSSATGMLASLLKLAAPEDVGWLTEKLNGIELGEAAQNAWNDYLALVNDPTPPVITVLGANPVTVTCGGTYTDGGATATDNKDGNLTGSITTTTTVNTDTVGTYAVTYSVKDAAGNEATAVRTVEVHYSFDGFLGPIGGADASGGTAQAPVKTFKAGSKIPVKFTIGCGIGLIHDGVHTLQVVKWNNEATAAEPIDASPADAATEGNQFRWADNHWQYILDTQTMNMGVGVWELRATLNDGSKHSVFIGVK